MDEETETLKAQAVFLLWCSGIRIKVREFWNIGAGTQQTLEVHQGPRSSGKLTNGTYKFVLWRGCLNILSFSVPFCEMGPEMPTLQR